MKDQLTTYQAHVSKPPNNAIQQQTTNKQSTTDQQTANTKPTKHLRTNSKQPIHHLAQKKTMEKQFLTLSTYSKPVLVSITNSKTIV